jgi:hypothetical protein
MATLIQIKKFRAQAETTPDQMPQREYVESSEYEHLLYRSLVKHFLANGMYSEGEVSTLKKIGEVWAKLIDEKSDELRERVPAIYNANNPKQRQQLERDVRKRWQNLAYGAFYLRYDSINWNETFSEEEAKSLPKSQGVAISDNELKVVPAVKKKNTNIKPE